MDTATNDDGLCVISPTTERTVMACPGLSRGQVRVELFDIGTTKFIAANAHRSSGEPCLGLSADGALLATASEKGTLIRVFDTHTGSLLHEFRRGSDRARVATITASPKKDLLRRHERQGHGAHLQGSEHPHRELKLGVWIPDADARRRQGDVVLPDRGVREKGTSKVASEWSRPLQTSLHRALPRPPSPPPTPIHASSSAREENTLASSSTSPRADACPRRAFDFLVPPGAPSRSLRCPNSLHPRVHPTPHLSR